MPLRMRSTASDYRFTKSLKYTHTCKPTYDFICTLIYTYYPLIRVPVSGLTDKYNLTDVYAAASSSIYALVHFLYMEVHVIVASE